MTTYASALDATVVPVDHPALPALLERVATGGRHVVLDMSALRTLDPDGLAALVRARQQVRQDRNGWLCLATPSRLVLTVLHTMRLERAFPTFADCPAALAWLSGSGDDPAEAPAPLWAGVVSGSGTPPA